MKDTSSREAINMALTFAIITSITNLSSCSFNKIGTTKKPSYSQNKRPNEDAENPSRKNTILIPIDTEEPTKTREQVMEERTAALDGAKEVVAISIAASRVWALNEFNSTNKNKIRSTSVISEAKEVVYKSIDVALSFYSDSTEYINESAMEHFAMSRNSKTDLCSAYEKNYTEFSNDILVKMIANPSAYEDVVFKLDGIKEEKISCQTECTYRVGVGLKDQPEDTGYVKIDIEGGYQKATLLSYGKSHHHDPLGSCTTSDHVTIFAKIDVVHIKTSRDGVVHVWLYAYR